jgi:hypothetical protein
MLASHAGKGNADMTNAVITDCYRLSSPGDSNPARVRDLGCESATRPEQHQNADFG